MRYSISELLKIAVQSSFFKELYKGVNISEIKTAKDLARLPVTDHHKYWEAHKWPHSGILTSKNIEGLLFKSGGSTGNPKFSIFTKDEWETFTDIFGHGIGQGILADGDRVANLFYSGDLYASFLFIKDSIQASRKKVLQFPVTGGLATEAIVKVLQEFDVNVVVGVPTSILKILAYLNTGKVHHNIQKILFGGESMYPDQLEWIHKEFPEAQVASVGYASVDAGLLGYADVSCKEGEHRVFDGDHVIEILDETTEAPIYDCGKKGRLYVTNLTRGLTPIIRYPAGDLAEWVEPESSSHRKFKILGRSEEGARVGTVTFYFDDIRNIIEKARPLRSAFEFQMEILHFEHRDQLVLKISEEGLDEATQRIVSGKIQAQIQLEKPTYVENLEKELLHPIQIQWLPLMEFEQNARTGKLKRVVDRRF